MLKIICPILVLLTACSQKVSNAVLSLHKLSAEEVYSRMKQRNFDPLDVVYKDINGNVITTEKWYSLSIDSFYFDKYADTKGVVREYRVRKKMADDSTLQRKMKQLFDTDKELNIRYFKHIIKDSATLQLNLDLLEVRFSKIQVPKMDCNTATIALDSIYRRDQADNRSSPYLTMKRDAENLAMVKDLLDNCNLLNDSRLTEDNYLALFLVIQHSKLEEMKKYYPFFEKCVEANKLKKKTLVLMEDRILMGSKQKQKYGTQVIKNPTTEKWELYPVEDEQHLDERRKAVGLGPIEEYLNHFK